MGEQRASAAFCASRGGLRTMNSESVRRYLLLSVEFGAYCALMMLLSYLMVLIVLEAPQPGSTVYITAGVLAALFTGVHSARMFHVYRAALRRAHLARSKPRERPRHWSDRIAATERVNKHDLLRTNNAVEDASPELEAIRLRIAERMAREDREQSEQERQEREAVDRERLERARNARIRAEAERRVRQRQ
ncbi:hypothetical protein ACNFJ7_07050 [Sphingomonas sp. HT-1]|uniref:hypothetical protein n=1 Tax=unclassified Sphingomonas TaxID=196159 RepID=UPI000A498B16|nr:MULTISPECIES: hypothetical protein [unclassified Sphingomonas]